MKRSEVLPAVFLRTRSVWDIRKCCWVSAVRRFADHVAFIFKSQAVQERNLKLLIPEDVGIMNFQIFVNHSYDTASQIGRNETSVSIHKHR